MTSKKIVNYLWHFWALMSSWVYVCICFFPYNQLSALEPLKNLDPCLPSIFFICFDGYVIDWSVAFLNRTLRFMLYKTVGSWLWERVSQVRIDIMTDADDGHESVPCIASIPCTCEALSDDRVSKSSIALENTKKQNSHHRSVPASFKYITL